MDNLKTFNWGKQPINIDHKEVGIIELKIVELHITEKDQPSVAIVMRHPNRPYTLHGQIDVHALATAFEELGYKLTRLPKYLVRKYYYEGNLRQLGSEQLFDTSVAAMQFCTDYNMSNQHSGDVSKTRLLAEYDGQVSGDYKPKEGVSCTSE